MGDKTFVVKILEASHGSINVYCNYLLHLSNGMHYIGATTCGISRRFARHLSGGGSRWLYSWIKRGVEIRIGYVEGAVSSVQVFEREKKRKSNRRKYIKLCEICRKDKKEKW
jgi:predicted GIY-YIG superfamily endonuclease